MSTVVVMTKKGKQSRAEIQRNYRIKKLLLDPEAARLKERERWIRPWSMVHDPWSWSMVHIIDPRSMVHGLWSTVNGSMVNGQLIRF